MKERQAQNLARFLDTVQDGSALAAICALEARLAEREPVRYTLSPLAEALLTAAPETASP